MEVNLTHFLRGALRVRQPVRGYRFNVDSVLLAQFAGVRDGDRVVDLGAGTGILLLLAGHFGHPASLTGVELQPELAELCRENLAENGWEEFSDVRAADLRDPLALSEGVFDLAVANPPYHGAGRSQACADPAKDTSRRDASLSPAELAASAARALCPGGRFCLLVPEPRREEVLDALGASGLSLQVLRAVRPAPGQAPYVHLVQLKRGAVRGPVVLPDLCLRGPDGQYTPGVARFLDGDLGPRPRFIADAMLGRLARHLRLMGYDVAYAHDAPDAWLQREARRSGRVLLTRDRELARAAARRNTDVFDPGHDDVAVQRARVAARFGPPPPGAAPRCLSCNVAPLEVDKGAARGLVPPYTWLTHDRFRACPGCGTLTWQGSHLERFRARIGGGP